MPRILAQEEADFLFLNVEEILQFTEFFFQELRKALIEDKANALWGEIYMELFQDTEVVVDCKLAS